MSTKASYFQPMGELFPYGKTFGQYLEENSAKNPEKVIIIHEDQQYTYRSFNEAVDNLALCLIDQGFKKGDIIGLCLPDLPEYSIMYYACAKIGVATSPISPRYREKEFIMMLGHSGARGAMIPKEWGGFDYVNMFKNIRSSLPSLKYLFVKGSETIEEDVPGFIKLEAVMAKEWKKKYPGDYLHDVYLKENPLDADNLLEVAYTSGTTGAPKGAMHSHNTRAAASFLNARRWGATPNDIMLLMAPLAHATGNAHAQNSAVLVGHTVVYTESYSPEAALKAIERFKITVPIGVPAMYIGIMNHPDFDKYNVSSVRGAWSGGAAAPVEVARKITEVFGCKFMSGYGTTECAGNHFTYPDDPIEVACSTVGPPLDTTEVKIVDSEGNTAPLGVAGEVCARGVTRLIGYYKNPEATANAIDDRGWFHSGDLGVIDEKGYLQIVGRIKDMIVRGGENIYASEIEELLYTHPDVLEAHVVGYPDDVLGERTCAFIIPQKEGKVFTRDEIVTLFTGKIAKYKIPDRVETVTQLPLTPSGKVKKFQLRKEAAGLVKT